VHLGEAGTRLASTDWEMHRFTALSPHLADPNFDDAAQNIDTRC
jgi:hypothetical protein